MSQTDPFSFSESYIQIGDSDVVEAKDVRFSFRVHEPAPAPVDTPIVPGDGSRLSVTAKFETTASVVCDLQALFDAAPTQRITVEGVDQDGNPITETFDVAPNTMVVSRRAYASLGGVTVYGSFGRFAKQSKRRDRRNARGRAWDRLDRKRRRYLPIVDHFMRGPVVYVSPPRLAPVLAERGDGWDAYIGCARRVWRYRSDFAPFARQLGMAWCVRIEGMFARREKVVALVGRDGVVLEVNGAAVDCPE